MIARTLFLLLVQLLACCIAASEYEIVHPFRMDKHRSKRDLSTRVNDVLHEDAALFGFETKKGTIALNVKRNKGFHSDKILLRTFDEDGRDQAEAHAPESCYYHGKIVDNEQSDVILSTCNGIRGQVDDGEKIYYIEPIEGREDEGAHKFYEAPEDPVEKRFFDTVSKKGMDQVSIDDGDSQSDDSEAVVKQSMVMSDASKASMLSRYTNVESQYIKYLTTTKTRYCEIFLVVDNAIYRKYGNDTKLVTERMLNLIHAVDRSYAAINIRLVLVALEIWTDKNKMNYTSSGGGQVSAFNTYRKNNLLGLVDHDIAHYFSIRGWSGGVIGMAYINGVCSKGHGSAINLWSFNSITGPNVVFGHELGHNFNFPHDASMVNCTCLTRRGCFMGGSKSRRPGFTDCNMRRLAQVPFTCLNNYPTGPIEKKCGNGIKEADEECDCGTPEMCKRNDQCCQPHDCKLKVTSQCSDINNPDCCKDCLFKKQGALCREAQNMCDLPEYCMGNKPTCPKDLYRKDGKSCSNHVSIIMGNNNHNSEKTVRLNPPIKARYLRINPVYKNNGGSYCMRLELLTCSANEDTSSQATPISTRDLYYTSSLCISPSSANCSDSITSDPAIIFKWHKFNDCNKPNMLFSLENDGTLRHKCSGKVVCPVSKFLFLKTNCTANQAKYERLGNYGLRHKATGNCLEANSAWPFDGKKTELRGTKNCDGNSHRTKLQFLEQDCLLPIGMENGKLPDSAFTASSSAAGRKPSDARLQSGKGWCLDKKAGKSEYLQVDMGQVKTVAGLKTQGASWDYVTGYKLFYSDDGLIWKGYKSSDDTDKHNKPSCFSGSCGASLNTQCKDLWDAGAKSANESCWNKLNTEAAGYGTCVPMTNKTCASGDIFCGQIQCSSSKNTPYHIKYGTAYKQFDLGGKKCSAASITINNGQSSDEFGDGQGMVKDGTMCGDKKMCYNYKCQSISDLKIKECGMVNGSVCARRGMCDNTGKCHCDRGYDPNTDCKTVLEAIHGNWGLWNEWSPCTAACDGGKRHRSRFCDTPFPAHGGLDCPGAKVEDVVCNTQSCPKARSCKDLLQKLKLAGKPARDAVYAIQFDDKTVRKVYCDMTRDGGGWTLIVSSHTNDWTSSDMVRERNIDKPDLLKDYSMLKYADQIKDTYLIKSKTYEFRVEAQNRGHWGGIWEAPSTFKIDTNSSAQADIVLKKTFDNWVYDRNGLTSVVPFVSGNRLTMNTRGKWGSFTGNVRGYHPAPWILGTFMESTPEHIWYWIREGDYQLPNSCMEVMHRELNRGKVPQSRTYTLKSEDGKPLNALCDMTSFGGGWTLLLNKVSGAGWTKDTLLARNVDKASKSKEYSILSHSKTLLGLLKEEDSFQYMIEADEEKRWGGVFEGQIKDGLTSCTPSGQKPKLLKKFDQWDESKINLGKTNPYVVENLGSLFTTSLKPSVDGTGVLVSQSMSTYMPSVMEQPRFVRFWVREGASYKSCNQMKTIGQRRGVVYKDGYYNLKATGADIRTVYCDMTSDPGAWTLLVTSATGGWTKEQVKSRNENNPSIAKDYSILHLADSIKDLSNNGTFRYKLDANKFNHWGGIWEAPITYSFVFNTYKHEKVKLLKQFDVWKYNVWYATVNNRMPWLGGKSGILTTSGTADNYWWGTIISDNLEYKPAPWISGPMSNPGLIWYWVNEDDCDADRKQVDGGLTPWSMWTKCSAVCGQGEQSRERQCAAPKPRCGGSNCNGNVAETQSCTGKCQVSPIKSSDSLYCVLPKQGGCNPADGTPLIWRKDLINCDLPEAQFVFDSSSGSMTHNCSGKPVCPNGGSNGYSTPLVISQTNCPAMKLTRHFIRTHLGSINFGGKCIHPSGSSQRDNVALVLWPGCFGDKLVQNLYKIAHGPVHEKYWSSLKITKKNIADLTSDVRFPNNPTSTGFLDNFDSPYDLGSNYGVQLHSILVAPETGFYTFVAACDDFCRIFLSNSSLEKDKVKIIDVGGWASQYQYDRRSDQKSDKIYLEVGRKYYIEALLVEMGGGDHLSVGVTLPSGLDSKPIDGYYLADNAD